MTLLVLCVDVGVRDNGEGSTLFNLAGKFTFSHNNNTAYISTPCTYNLKRGILHVLAPPFIAFLLEKSALFLY